MVGKKKTIQLLLNVSLSQCVFACTHLLVSCLSRPSCAPSWWCERWCSWEWAECSVLTAQWAGSAAVPESSACGAKTGTNSASSSSTSSSFSAPSHSDAGPKWVCSSVGWWFKGHGSKLGHITVSYEYLTLTGSCEIQNFALWPLDGSRALSQAATM